LLITVSLLHPPPRRGGVARCLCHYHHGMGLPQGPGQGE